MECLSVREEDLQTLRQRLNDWAARECPVLRTPPLECDLSVHLDRLTVESVRRLDQLAPYGADNPSPVFVLERAVVEGVYAVSEGKHCRLRLRQGGIVGGSQRNPRLTGKPYQLGQIAQFTAKTQWGEEFIWVRRVADIQLARIGAYSHRPFALLQKP